MKKNDIHSKLSTLSLVLLLMGIANYTLAQERFPNKPLTIIVPFAAGGVMDLDARALKPHVEKSLGQPVVVLNREGAGGTIAFNEGATSLPDGYTITQVSPAIIASHYIIRADVHYRQFVPVSINAFSPGTITISAASPWRSLKDLIDYGKANPGKIRAANAGFGSASHIRLVGLEIAAGIKFTHVPYKGLAPAQMAVMGGHVEVVSPTLSAGLLDLVKSGKLRNLAVTSRDRVLYIPDVPSCKELGVDYENDSWYGFLAPKGTPKDRIYILHNAFRKAAESQEYIAFAKRDAVTVRYPSLEEITKLLEKEDEVWSRIIDAAGIPKVK